MKTDKDAFFPFGIVYTYIYNWYILRSNLEKSLSSDFMCFLLNIDLSLKCNLNSYIVNKLSHLCTKICYSPFADSTLWLSISDIYRYAIRAQGMIKRRKLIKYANIIKRFILILSNKTAVFDKYQAGFIFFKVIKHF